MSRKNLCYAQSGGVTPVMNATACGVIETARKMSDHFANILCAKNGILGVLQEELFDTSLESAADIAALKHTPSGAFGSCRYKLRPFAENQAEYVQLVKVLTAHNVGAFLYNGGGDSQDTSNKLAQIFQQLGADIQCIGVPKTIDNDLAITDNCPGFASVAKYVALSIMEAGFDVESMCASSTKIFVMEVMGRHTGWIAAAAGLARTNTRNGPHIILFPERPLQEDAFLERVQQAVTQYGYCSIVVSEGVKDTTGRFIAESSATDAFGHVQLGGVAPHIAELIKKKLGHKYHWAVLDYLQRAARHASSLVDVEQAYALGAAAVHFAAAGKSAVMPIIVRQSNTPYQWSIEEADLSQVANIEKKLPADFISADGFSITDKARQYLLPLIQGEAFPPYENGLPKYIRLQNQLVAKKVI